jgi:UDP-N-acetylmuramoylalanine-D-glutamate ligase
MEEATLIEMMRLKEAPKAVSLSVRSPLRRANGHLRVTGTTGKTTTARDSLTI